MSVDPREQWQKIQQRLQQTSRAGFQGGLPGGGAAGRGFVALVALGLGAFVLSNSIFNGTIELEIVQIDAWLMFSSGWWSPGD
jgi:hypothetical protein